MARRNPKLQKAHNKGLLHEAEDLEDLGWDVWADLPGEDYPEPEEIGKHKPGIVARKGVHTRIVEIETDPDEDHQQHKSFKLSATQQGHNTIFYGRIVDERVRRVDSFGNPPGDILG